MLTIRSTVEWRQLAPLITLVLLLAATATASAAQETLWLEELWIDLWPEHDRPDVLVIYRGTLPVDTPLPATLTLHLPPGVDAPYAVAYQDENGNLLNTEHSTTQTQAGLRVTMEVPALNFQLEFYDGLASDGNQRRYTFSWPGDYAVDRLTYQLVPPPQATEVRTDPNLFRTQDDPDNPAFIGRLDNLSEGQTVRLTLSYRTPGPGVENGPTLVIGIALTALLLGAGGVVWYTRRSRARPVKRRSTQRSRGHSPRSRGHSPRLREKCVECGNALSPDDHFCGHCGTPANRN